MIIASTEARSESIKVKEIKTEGIVLEIVPSICKECRNFKGIKCKKGLEPKGKLFGGLKCARFHNK